MFSAPALHRSSSFFNSSSALARAFSAVALGLTISGAMMATPQRAEAQPFAAADTSLVSIGTYSGATLPNATGESNANPRQSKNGRFVVFQSKANNLVNTASGRYQGFTFNTNNNQIYLLDRQSGTLELISQIGTNNQPAPMDSYDPAISADGRYVSYIAPTDGDQAEFMRAQVVQPGSTYNGLDVAITDIDGTVAPVNGCIDRNCHVNYWVDGTHVWVRDRLANENFLASQVTIPVKIQKRKDNGLELETQDVTACQANCRDKTCIDDDDNATPPAQTFKYPVMSEDSIRIAQGILVDNNPLTITEAVAANPFLAGEGRFLVFDSDSNLLAGIVNPDLFPEPVCRNSGDPISAGDFDGVDGIIDNGFVSVPGCCFIDDIERDLNGLTANLRDVFVRDGAAANPTTASVPENKIASFGCQFYGTTGCIVQGNADAIRGTISDDGQFVSFESKATTFLSLDFNGDPDFSDGFDPTDPGAYTTGGSDIFVVERSLINSEIKNLTRVSNASNRITAANNATGDAASTEAVLSADGRYVVFQSSASNIVTDDTNGKSDVFVYDRAFFTPVRCVSSTGVQGNDHSLAPDVSGNGETVAFVSASTNFGAAGGFANAFLGRLSKDADGRVIGCAVELGSIGAGTGANGNVTNVSVGVQPKTETLADSTTQRTRVASLAYLSDATNLQSAVTDSNGDKDVFFAPNCSTADLATDRDGDGTNDCFDQCWEDPLKVEDADTDSDGIANCEDGCTADPQKTAPGICGCGVTDNDSDADGAADCNDLCPNDRFKTAPGQCGCGQVDEDSDNNGVIDCTETVLPTPTPGAGIPTPGPTPTPVVYTQVVPQRPDVINVSGRRVQIVLPLTGIPTASALTRFEVRLTRRTNGASRTSSFNVNVADGNSVVRNVKAGRYTAKFRVRNAGNQVTKFSPLSTSIRVR
jgi:hypothetical protein